MDAAEKKSIREKTAKPMLWLAIVSICMFFGAFTSAYVVSSSDSKWVTIPLPSMFYFSTAVILLSSITMTWATQAAKKDNYNGTKLALLITLVLGFAFVIFQYQGWAQLWREKVYFMGSSSHPAGSYLYLITLVHILHLVGGIIALLVTLSKSFKQSYNSQNLLGLQLCAIYWHFLDGLWIYLFFFLLLFR